MRLRSITFPALLLLIATLLAIANGQQRGGTIIEKPSSKSAEEPTQRTKAPVRTIYRVEFKTPSTGSLSVSAEPGAKILVEPLNVRGQEAKRATVPDDQRGFIFNGLKPGLYRVAGTLVEHREDEKKITISATKKDCCSVTLNFEPILYSVTINTNVDSGELKYGKKGETPRVRMIQKKSTLQLPAGDYEAELNAPEGMGYKSRHETISVKDNMEVDFSLERIRTSTETLRPNWTAVELEGWDVPATWHAEAKKLIVHGPGVALPRDENKRYYKDFQLSSNITKFNNEEIGFALRAQDTRNYYLLDFTGEKADEPYTMRLFVVKNGVAKRLQGIEIVGEPKSAIKAGQFSVVVKMLDNRIEVVVEDNSNGTSYSLGALVDPDRTYPVGAVGIASRSNDESAVWQFHVCTDCLKNH